MNNMFLYFDSADAQSIGWESSKNYELFFFANIPNCDKEDFMTDTDEKKEWDSEMIKLFQKPNIVSFVITDILYCRFLLSISALFSITENKELLSLLLSSAERVFESKDRAEVLKLISSPDPLMVEELLHEVVSASIAQDEMLAIGLSKRFNIIRDRLYGDDADSLLSSFEMSERMVAPFILRTSKKQIEDVIREGEVITVCNDASAIHSVFPTLVLEKEDERLFKSILTFSDAICSVFHALFVEGQKSEKLDDAYKKIWTLVLKTNSSCYVPQSAYDKAREVLL